MYKYISGIWDRKHKDFCYQSHQRNFPSFSTENNRFLYQVKVALLTILVNTTGNQQTNAVPENSAASTNGGTPKVITNNKSLAMNLLLFKKKKKKKRCYYVSLRKTVPSKYGLAYSRYHSLRIQLLRRNFCSECFFANYLAYDFLSCRKLAALKTLGKNQKTHTLSVSQNAIWTFERTS